MGWAGLVGRLAVAGRFFVAVFYLFCKGGEDMTFLFCALGCVICFLCGVWAGVGAPMPRGLSRGTEVDLEIDVERKKTEEKLKEQWENLFSYNGESKE